MYPLIPSSLAALHLCEFGILPDLKSRSYFSSSYLSDPFCIDSLVVSLL